MNSDRNTGAKATPRMSIYCKYFLCLFLPLSLSGCFWPEKFTATIDVKSDKTYVFHYRGLLTYVPVVAEIKRSGKLRAEDEANVKTLEKEILEDPGIKSCVYKRDGRFDVIFEQSGKIDRPIKLLNESINILAIMPAFNGIEIYGMPLDDQGRQTLDQLELGLDGTIEVKSDLKVTSHNAQSSPLFGMIGAYKWHLTKQNYDPPKIVLSDESDSSFPNIFQSSPSASKAVGKSDAETAVRKFLEARSTRQDVTTQFIGTLHTPLGKLVDLWEVRKLDVAVTPGSLTEADRLNGFEDRVTFEVTGSAFRMRDLFPHEKDVWSQWGEGGVLLTGIAQKNGGVWTVDVIRDNPIGGNMSFTLEKPEVYEKQKAQERSAAESKAQRVEISKIPTMVIESFEFPQKFPSYGPEKQEITLTDVDIEYRSHYGAKMKVWFGAVNRLGFGSRDDVFLVVNGDLVPMGTIERRNEYLVKVVKAFDAWQIKYPDINPKFKLNEEMKAWVYQQPEKESAGSTTINPEASDRVRLSFKGLSQIDQNNYDPGKNPRLSEVEDLQSDGSRQKVSKLACLASVYTMIERARGGGNPKAFIDKFYPDPRDSGGDTQGPLRPQEFKVDNDQPLNADALEAALKQGEPVILHACRGFCGTGVFQHFGLAVGVGKDVAGARKFTVLDPWPKSGDVNGPAQEYELSLEGASAPVPDWNEVDYRQMRLIHWNAAKNAKVGSQPAKSPGLDSSEAKQAPFYGKWRLTRHAPAGKPWVKPDWGEEVMEVSPGGRYEINGRPGTWSLNPNGDSLTLTSGISRNTARRDGDSIELTDRTGGLYTYSSIHKNCNIS